jgi:ubiquinone/menaquinone biosynthesis C-methylase UbiE
VVGDAVRLPLADAAVDLALCLENSLAVLFGRERAALAEMVRVVRPGGRVVLGLRERPGATATELVRHYSGRGYLELARTFARADVERIVDGAAGVTGRRVVTGGPRPWGGEVYYLVLDVADGVDERRGHGQ